MISGRRLFVAEFAIDLRFGTNRLLALAFQANLDPRKGDVILFGGRNRRRLKVLHGDDTGLWLSSKTYTEEEARCRISALRDGTMREISNDELAWLIIGKKEKVEG